MFCEGSFLFFFTPNVLMYSGLRGVGEVVKEINENLLTCGRCRRTRTRVVRESARDRAFIGEERERKWGRERRGRGERRAERKSIEIGRWCRA